MGPAERLYPPKLVENLLKNYADFRLNVECPGVKPQSGSQEPPVVRRTHELPLGQHATDLQPWPFQERKHASEPRDGKMQAKNAQEIHVSMIDLEVAFDHIAYDDQTLLLHYYVFQTHTLEELRPLCDGITPKGVHNRLSNIVRNLSDILEKGPYNL